MYIKNRRNRCKFTAFRLISKFVINRKFGASKSPTFHILTVTPPLNTHEQT
jgi:hypothetical protein